MIDDALNHKIISVQEHEVLKNTQEAKEDVIGVDSFDSEVYKNQK